MPKPVLNQRTLFAALAVAVASAIILVGGILDERGSDDAGMAIQMTGIILLAVIVIGIAAYWFRAYSRKQCLQLAAGAVGAFVVAVLLHNVISGLFDIDEPVSFIIATVVCPAAFIGALIAAALPRHHPPVAPQPA